MALLTGAHTVQCNAFSQLDGFRCKCTGDGGGRRKCTGQWNVIRCFLVFRKRFAREKVNNFWIFFSINQCLAVNFSKHCIFVRKRQRINTEKASRQVYTTNLSNSVASNFSSVLELYWSEALAIDQLNFNLSFPFCGLCWRSVWKWSCIGRDYSPPSSIQTEFNSLTLRNSSLASPTLFWQKYKVFLEISCTVFGPQIHQLIKRSANFGKTANALRLKNEALELF